MQNKSWWKTTLLLISIFIVLIIIGRYFFGHSNSSIQDSSGDGTLIIGTSTTSSVSPSTNNSTSSNNSPLSTTTACAENLEAQTKSNNTQYEKGDILVGFKADITFDKAVSLLASYNATVKDTTDQEQSFADNQIITASITPGKEFLEICLLKEDASIRYVGLDTLFSMHD